MNAVYARVSTEEQARSGYSLADQIKSCRNRLLTMGLAESEIQEYVDEGYSGEFLDRPAMDRLRNDLRAGLLQNIIVYDPDRLARNLTHMLLIGDEIEKHKAKLLFVTGDYEISPEGKLFFSIRGAVAAFEKEKIRERTIRGKRSKAMSGKVIANRQPYGYDWDEQNCNYTINTQEAAIVKYIYGLCLDGYGLKKIAIALNEKGLVNKHGKPFKFKYVYNILKSELYSGTNYEFREQWKKISQSEYDIKCNPRDEWISISVPAIISKELQAKVLIQFDQNYKLSHRNTRKDYLLTGIIKCGICGMGMCALPGSEYKKQQSYYVCYGKRENKNCPGSKYIPISEIENDVWNYILDIAKGKVNILDIIKQKDETLDRTAEIDKHSKIESQLLLKRDEITSWFVDGLIAANTAKKTLNEINKELNRVTAMLNSLHQTQEKSQKAIPNINLSHVLDANTTREKQKLLRSWNLKVYVTRENKMNQFILEV